MDRNWEIDNESGFVKVNDHRLFLRASGPARQTPGVPAIIIEHGLGGSSIEWVPAIELISKFARVYSYERAGYYPSDRSTKPPTPSNIVADLKALLDAASIPPPYLLVGHSYGGVLIRQFLADFGSQALSGMVIVDSAPEPTKLPNDWATLLGDSTYERVVGLEANHCLSVQDYETLLEIGKKNEGPGGIAEEESKHQPEGRILNERIRGKQLLGSKPLSVIMCDESNDMRKVYEHGIRFGHGTPAAQEALRVRLEDMAEIDEAAMRSHLVLSSNSRFVMAQGKTKTHNSHIIDPSLVVGEIEWVYEQSLHQNEP